MRVVLYVDVTDLEEVGARVVLRYDAAEPEVVVCRIAEIEGVAMHIVLQVEGAEFVRVGVRVALQLGAAEMDEPGAANEAEFGVDVARYDSKLGGVGVFVIRLIDEARFEEFDSKTER